MGGEADEECRREHGGILLRSGRGYHSALPALRAAFRRLVDEPVIRVVLLGPSHFAALRGVALPGAAAMRTPLGDIPVEDAPLPRNPRAHVEEHSLEVELPFLQVALRSL